MGSDRDRRLQVLEDRRPSKPRTIRMIVEGDPIPEDADDVVVLTAGRPVWAVHSEPGSRP